jgi:hypothetical protein
MINRKLLIEIEGLLKIEGTIQWYEDIPIVPPYPVDPDKPTEPIKPEKPDLIDLDSFLESDDEVIYLSKLISNKEVNFRSKGFVKTGSKRKYIIGENVVLSPENWEVAPTQIIDCQDENDIAFIGITFALPPNHPKVTGFPDCEIFGWERNKVKKGFFGYLNNQQLPEDRVTYGLSRFCYSSDGDDRIYLVAKNIYHNGFNFTQTKNPYKGNLWNIWENVKIHNPRLDYRPMTSIYTPTDFGLDCNIENGIATVTSDNKLSQVLTWHGYHFENIRCIFNVGRFIFDMNDESVIDEFHFDLQLVENGESFLYEIDEIYEDIFYSEKELHPGDETNLGKIHWKMTDYRTVSNSKWAYGFDDNGSEKNGFGFMIKSSFNTDSFVNGEIEGFRAGIVYKNASHLVVGIDTGFWNNDIILSNGYGWTWYNNEMSGYLKNVVTSSKDKKGKENSQYCRNSSGQETQGLTMIDCNIPFNPPVPTSENEMPLDVKEKIEFWESLPGRM